MEKLLEQLGLGNKERSIYALILEHGKIAPALLARLAKINRTTVYSVAKELKDKGLIIEDLGGKTLYYLPARAPELEKIIKAEHEKASQKEKTLRELQEFLKNIPESKTYSVPKIRFVEEDDLENYLYEAFPRWIENVLLSDKNTWGFQDHTLVEKFEKWIDWSWEHTPPDVEIKLLTNRSEIEEVMKNKKYKERRHMRFLHNKEFSASQLVMGSYIILLMTRQRPYYLVEIHDSVMAQNIRELFKELWKGVE